MPTYREDMHTGHKVPLVETDDIIKGAVTTDKLDDKAVTTEKLADKAVTTTKIEDKAVITDKLDDGSVTTPKIADKAVTTLKIEDEAVVTAKIADRAVTTEKIADDAVTNEKIGEGEVKTRNIGTGAVTTDKMPDEAVTTEKLHDGAVTAPKIDDDAVTTAKIADGAVQSRHIQSGAIDGDKLQDGIIEGRHVKDNSVPGSKLKDGTIESVDIKDGTLSGAKLVDNSVDGEKLADNAIESRHLKDNSIPASKIKDGTIENVDIKDGTLGGEKIKDNTIEGTKIADGAIGTDKIVDNSINTVKIADGAVTESKIADNSVTNVKIGAGAVTTEKIENEAITEEKLAPGAVTTDKLSDGMIEQLQTITDAVPTEGSVKPVQSGGTHAAIAAAVDAVAFSTGEKVNEVSIDDEPTAGSDNLVKSGGVQNELALGAVYDVSAKNPTAGPNNDGKFESLSALLSDASLNALIPTAVRRGGMSIKFVQSSDNKYVQYRLINQNFTTNIGQWQCIDCSSVGDNLFSQMVEGCITLFGNWERGSINIEHGTYIDNPRRIRTAQKVKYDVNVVVKVANGFKMRRLNYEYQSDIVPASYNELYPNNTYTIPKDTWMAFEILRVTEDPSETADIEYFKKQIAVVSQTETNRKNIETLQGNVSTLSEEDNYIQKLLSDENNSEHIFDGFSTLTGLWERGAIGASGDYAANNRVRNKNIISYPEDIELKIKNGFRAYYAIYDNITDTVPSSTTSPVAQNSNFTIPANTLFRVVILRNTEITENADIEEFKQALLVYSTLYSNKQFIDFIKDDIFLNIRQNVLRKEYIANYKLSGKSGGGYDLIEVAAAKCLIIPIQEYGNWSYIWDDSGVQRTIEQGTYLKVGGLRSVRWGHRATLLDGNMQTIGDNAHANSWWSWSTDDYVVDLRSAGFYLAKFIAIKLFDESEFGNQNPEYGYVWSEEEITNKIPNWDIVINFNFTDDVNAKDRKTVEKGMQNKFYDKSREYCFQKFGNRFSDKFYNLSYLQYHQNFNFILASDSHISVNGASRRNVEDMIDFVGQDIMASKIDCILHNGDVSLFSGITTKQQTIDMLEDYFDIVKHSAVPYIQSVGNHDKGQEAFPYACVLTNAELAELFAEYTYQTSETSLYEYYDFVDKNIRVVKIDAFDYPLEEVDGKPKYDLSKYDCYISQAQFQWIVSTLLSTPANYNIILTGHIYPNDVLVEPLTELLYAVKNKLSGTLAVDLSGETRTPPNPTFSVSYDFTGANNVNIVGLFGGHDHLDSFVNTTEASGVIPNSHGVNVFGIRCQMMKDNRWNTKCDRFPYTESQNCFNMFAADIYNKKLYVFRYGVEADRLASQTPPILYGADVFDIM